METKKLNRYLLLFIMALLLHGIGAETILIGSGTVLNQGLPIEPVARYTYSQQLIMASEISAGGVISQLGFHYNVASTLFFAGNRQLKLWLGHTSRSTMPSWMPVDSLVLVYDGMLSESDFTSGLPGNGWLLINLGMPFSYNGTDNLVLAADENSFEYGNTSDDFLCTDGGFQRSIQFQSHTINPDPEAPPASGFSLKTHRSNLRIEIAAVHYYPVLPFPADNSSQVAIDTNFSWVSNCSSFDFKLGTHPDSLITLALNINQCLWQLQSPLQYNRQYYWKVIGHYGGENYPSALWSFNTASESISPPQNLAAVYHSPVVQLSWQPPQTGVVHYYRIYRNSAPLINTPNPAYEDANIQPGLTYYYYVTAFAPSGSESTPSNLVSVTIPSYPNTIVLQGLEDAPAFSSMIPGWQSLDLDNSLTWSWDNVTFPHEGEALGWICFTPDQTIPPLTNITPVSGSKMAMSASALSPPNNDWLISPPLHLGNSASLSYQARSATADYGLERLKLLVSTTSNDPSAFTPLSAGAYQEIPAVWTEYSQNLDAYHNQRIFLAWQCVSLDAFALFLDDIAVVSEGGWVNVEDDFVPASGISCYPNPSRGSFMVKSSLKAPLRMEIYNLKGRKLFAADNLQEFSSEQLQTPLASGIYFLRITQAGHSQVLKQVIIR